MKAQLQNALKDALRAKDRVKLDTLRSLLSAIQYEEMQRGIDELSEQDSIEVLRRELKKRKEEMEFAEKSSRGDLQERIAAESATIEAFLPQQMSAPEIEKVITELRSSDPSLNMGGIMKLLKERYSGRYDSKTASDIARRVCG